MTESLSFASGELVHETRSDRSLPTAVLLEKSGRFFFYEPGLAVIASGDNIEEAYEKFAAARRHFLEEVERAGLTASRPGLPQPSRRQIRLPAGRSIPGELGLFLAKTCIVLLVIGAIGAIAAIAAINVVRSVSGLVANVSAGLKPITLADVARKAADVARDAQSLSEDDRELLRQSVGIISREAAPIVDAWRNPPPLPEPKPDTGTPAETNKPGR